MQIGFVFLLFFWGEQCVGMFNVATTCRDKCRTKQEQKKVEAKVFRGGEKGMVQSLFLSDIGYL